MPYDFLMTITGTVTRAIQWFYHNIKEIGACVGIIVGFIAIGTFVKKIFSARRQSAAARAKRFQDVYQHVYTPQRYQLCEYARRFYRSVRQLRRLKLQMHTPLLYLPEWIPSFSGRPLQEDVEVILNASFNEVNIDTRHLLLPLPSESYADQVNEYILKGNRRQMVDNNSYRLYDVIPQPGGKLQLVVAPSSYFKFYNTCEVLSYELANAVSNRDLRMGYSILTRRKLKLRNKVSNIFALRNRHIGIGVNTLFIMYNNRRPEDRLSPNDPGHDFLMHFRSVKHTVAEAINTYHVIPAGIYQPPSNDFTNFNVDKDLRNTILREFCEELYNQPEFTFLETAQVLDKNQRVQRMKKLIDDPSKKWNVYFLGLGLDPLTTKCEILACMTCDLSDYRMKSFTPNEEGNIIPRVFTRDNLCEFIEDKKTLPAAKMILQIVHDHYDQFIVLGK